MGGQDHRLVWEGKTLLKERWAMLAGCSIDFEEDIIQGLKL